MRMGDPEEVVNYGLMIEGVEVAALLKEEKTGTVPHQLEIAERCRCQRRCLPFWRWRTRARGRRPAPGESGVGHRCPHRRNREGTGVNLVTLKDWSRQDILEVVEEGTALRRDSCRHRAALDGKTLALLFQKTSTRTRCSGEIGMMQLGGQAVYLDWTTTNFGLAELGDEVRVLSSYCDFIVARLLLHEDMLTTAESSLVPVMNGCCDRYHPMQILADLQTIQETFGPPRRYPTDLCRGCTTTSPTH